MMNRYALLVISCLVFCGVLDAQNTFTLEPNDVVRQIEVIPGEFQDFELHNQFINRSDETKTYVWERTEVYLPKDWQTAVCDINLCYLPHVSTMSFEIGSQDTFDMIVHAYNNGNLGDSVLVSLNVYEEGNPANSVTATYRFISMTTATDDIAGTDDRLLLYPNPTSQGFQLSSARDIHEVIVYNIVGKQVKQFNASRGRMYDIGDLQKGMYFVRLLNEKGTVEKTLRLNKE